MKRRQAEARRWFVHGRVQGVGFRYFVERAATELGLAGYARNLDDGRVEVYAVGPPERLAEMAARLHTGPRWSEVRGVDEQQAAVERFAGFDIR